jgi:molybdate transport system substrate-binding protein
VKRFMFAALAALSLASTSGVVVATPAVASSKRLSGSITVSAASSLTEAFTKLGADFQKANPGTTVRFNFAASSALVQQIQGGAPADVFASADGTNMQKLVAGSLVTAEPTVFAANDLTIVVKKGNPKRVTSLADLTKLDVVSLCADTVPCGKYAQQALAQAGVTVPGGKITKGADVKTTLAAVATGDADAAIVYTTDAKTAAKSVDAVRIPAWLNVYAIYPMAPVAASQNQTLAKAWIKYVWAPGGAGQKTLSSFGFLPPPAE